MKKKPFTHLSEFKTFAVKGNVIDLTVGIIIGTAFGKIITSLVNDIIMPPIGKLIGGVDFSNFFINLGYQHFDTLAEAQKAGAPTINYGIFINTILNFIVIAASIYVFVRALNRLRIKGEETKDCPFCFSKISPGATRCAHCTSELST